MTDHEPTVTEPSAALRESYDIAGPIGAPVIVFVHGMRLSRSMWAAQMAELGDSHRVIAVDLPGHGTLNARPFTLDAAADQVATVIETAANGRAVVVGLSLGGYVAMEVAARDPERVRALILAGASQEPIGLWSIGYRALATILRWFPVRAARFVDRRLFAARFPRDVADAVISGGFWPRGGAVAVRSLVGKRFVPVLEVYRGPVLIVNGEYDVMFRAGERRFLKATLDGRRTIIRGATHLTNLDRPDALALAVRAFVRRLPAEPGGRA